MKYLLHSATLSLLIVGLFAIRSTEKHFYNEPFTYIILILAAILLITIILYRSLTPNTLRGDGNFNWYLTRGWYMGFVGIVLSTLLVSVYAYKVDSEYFDRRIDWEQERIDKQKFSDRVKDMQLEEEQEYKSFHYEEVIILLFGGLFAFITPIGLSFFFAKTSAVRKTEAL